MGANKGITPVSKASDKNLNEQLRAQNEKFKDNLKKIREVLDPDPSVTDSGLVEDLKKKLDGPTGDSGKDKLQAENEVLKAEIEKLKQEPVFNDIKDPKAAELQAQLITLRQQNEELQERLENKEETGVSDMATDFQQKLAEEQKLTKELQAQVDKFKEQQAQREVLANSADSDSSSLEGQKPAIKVENIGSSKQGKAKVTTTTKKITTTTTTTTTWPDPWG